MHFIPGVGQHSLGSSAFPVENDFAIGTRSNLPDTGSTDSLADAELPILNHAANYLKRVGCGQFIGNPEILVPISTSASRGLST
jgi:hypothetical protein